MARDRGNRRRVLVFELEAAGHRAGYIQHLTRYWDALALGHELYVVTSPRFLELHKQVVAIQDTCRGGNIIFVRASESEAAGPRTGTAGSVVERAKQAIADWRTLCGYARRLNADHCVVLFFDRLLLTAGMLALDPPCSVSGIFLRPLFHYPRLSRRSQNIRERVAAFRQRALLAVAMRRSFIRTVFTLDPYVLEEPPTAWLAPKFVQLPDPVAVYDSDLDRRAALAARLGIEPHKRVLLSFGELGRRKGIEQIVAAVNLLEPTLASGACFLFIGPANERYAAAVRRLGEEQARSGGAQVIAENRFVPESEIQPYFELSDVVLACYQRHVGMSAILVRAAALGKPVIGSDYGAVGETIRRHALGAAVNASSPRTIALAISSFLRGWEGQKYDRLRMARFAQQNSPQEFARTIAERALV